MESIEERWLPVPNYEHGYEISNLGNVRSLFRNRKLLRPAADRQGYQRVMLYDQQGKTAKGHVIHRLVAAAFLFNPDGLPWVNHKNGKKDDNCLENLEWCDRAGNVNHAIKNGLLRPHTHSVFTIRECQAISRLKQIGFTNRAIAKIFETNELAIKQIQ